MLDMIACDLFGAYRFGSQLTRTALLLLLGGCLLQPLSAATATPNLNGGTWEPVDPPQTILTDKGKMPPLLPAAKIIYLQHIAERKAGKLDFDTTEKCLPPGTPRVLYMGPFEIAQQLRQVTFLYQWNRLVRTVLIDVPQPSIPGPTYDGQSVGKWINGTLVVDTVGMIAKTTLDAAGLPHGTDLHVTETYTPSTDGQRMTVRINIDDPAFYFRPWTTALQFRRNLTGEIEEDFCLQRKGIQWGGLRPTGTDIKETR